MTLIEGCDYFIYMMKMPPKIYACCTPNADGTYSIYLDPRRSYLCRKSDLEHELSHIRNNDFCNGRPIYEIEDYL